MTLLVVNILIMVRIEVPMGRVVKESVSVDGRHHQGRHHQASLERVEVAPVVVRVGRADPEPEYY